MSQPIEYHIVRSQRKTLALTFDKAGALLVRAPATVPNKIIQNFVNQNQAWVFRHQREILEKIWEKEQFTFTQGAFLPFLGEDKCLSNGNTPKIASDTIALPVSEKGYRQEYFDLLRREGKQYFPKRVAVFAPLVGAEPNRITITSAKTRWGSCSSKGNLCFSKYLMCLPPHLVDYVVVHELAHLLEHNHSSAFYSIIASVLPDYKSCVQELREVSLPFL